MTLIESVQMTLHLVLISSSLALLWLLIDMHPIVLFLLAGLVGGCCVFCVLIRQGYSRAYKTKWYDVSKNGPDEELEWSEIESILKFDDLDSMSDDRESRSPWIGSWPDRWPKKHLLIRLGFLATGLLLLWGTGKLIWQVHNDLTNCNNVDYLENLGMLIGGLAVGVAGFSIFYQGRLKARSENRHAWITSIRKEIANLLAGFPKQDTPNRQQCPSSLTRLELSLNPNARIHRVLVAILRSMYGLEDNSLYRVPQCEICIPGNLLADEDETVQQEWKIRATRLATVLLKREWERVKDVR